MEENMKEYKAIVWDRGPDAPGKRVSVMARSLAEATERLEAEYGKDIPLSVYNEEDADRPR
jgi:hypothetical protein